MKITDITVTQKGRYALFGDGAFLFSLHMDIMASAHIKIGDEVSIERLEELRLASELRIAKDRALRLLSHKAYTKKQLTGKLEKYADPEAATQAVERMEELGLINDEDYAARCARDLFNLKGYAPQRIKQELMHRGIDGELAAEAASAFEEDDVYEQICDLVRRKYAKHLDDQKGRDKTLAALARLGYRFDEIKSAMRLIQEELEESQGLAE